MRKKLLISSTIVVILIGLILLVITLGTADNDKEIEAVVLTGETKEFNIVATNWEFTPSLIEVSNGDKVELHLTSSQGTHGIAFLEFGVSEILKEGEDVHVEFIADQTGTFNFFCTVPCGKGHGAMRGLIVVK